MSDQFLAIFVALLLFGLVMLAAVAKQRRLRTLPVRSRRLMTARERDVISIIEAAVPHCRVHAQVAMGALIDCKSGLTRAQRTSVRNRFDRKVVDFVVEEKSSGDVVALIELDDRTHSDAKDRARDEITRAAGYRTLRLPADKRPDASGVRAQLLSALTETVDGSAPPAAQGSRRGGKRLDW